MSLASVNRCVKPTDAQGERVRTARRTGMNTLSQSEGKHLTGSRAPTQSEDRRVTESGGTLGQSCPTEERARRRRTPNTQDHARRRVANHQEQVCELGRAAHKLQGSTLEGTNYDECTGWLLSGRACA